MAHVISALVCIAHRRAVSFALHSFFPSVCGLGWYLFYRGALREPLYHSRPPDALGDAHGRPSDQYLYRRTLFLFHSAFRHRAQNDTVYISYCLVFFGAFLARMALPNIPP